MDLWREWSSRLHIVDKKQAQTPRDKLRGTESHRDFSPMSPGIRSVAWHPHYKSMGNTGTTRFALKNDIIRSQTFTILLLNADNITRINIVAKSTLPDVTYNVSGVVWAYNSFSSITSGQIELGSRKSTNVLRMNCRVEWYAARPF